MLRHQITYPPVDSDPDLKANSKARVPSQSAVKAYVDAINPEETGVIYIGDRNTNGSWRIRINGSFLITERRDAGVWIEKDAASGKTITR